MVILRQYWQNYVDFKLVFNTTNSGGDCERIIRRKGGATNSGGGAGELTATAGLGSPRVTCARTVGHSRPSAQHQVNLYFW